MSSNQQAPYIEAIQRKYPNFEVHAVSLDMYGQNNDVLVFIEPIRKDRESGLRHS